MCDQTLTPQELADKYGIGVPRDVSERLEKDPLYCARRCIEEGYRPVVHLDGQTTQRYFEGSRCYAVGKYLCEESKKRSISNTSPADFVRLYKNIQHLTYRAYNFYDAFYAYEHFRYRERKVVKNPDDTPGAPLFVQVYIMSGHPKGAAVKGLAQRDRNNYAHVTRRAPIITHREKESEDLVFPSDFNFVLPSIHESPRNSVLSTHSGRVSSDTIPSAPPLPDIYIKKPAETKPVWKDSPLDCPITCERMVDPVIASDGFTYERAAIEKWFAEGRKTSPMTNVVLTSSVLVPNRLVRNLLNPE